MALLIKFATRRIACNTIAPMESDIYSTHPESAARPTENSATAISSDFMFHPLGSNHSFNPDGCAAG
jgi:hypothetical protein